MTISDKGNGELTLYYFPTSYYSQRVVIALHEKRLKYISKYVNPLSLDQYKPWFLHINPKGQVPVLKDGVKIIPDSNRIVEYLDDNFSNGNQRKLIPREVGADIKQKIENYVQLVDSIPAFPLTFGSMFHSQYVVNPKPPISLPFVRNRMKEGVNKITDTIRGLLGDPDFPEQFKQSLEEKLPTMDDNINLLKDENKYKELLENLGKVLDTVESELASKTDKQWLCCEEFTLADIYLIVLLHRICVIGLDSFFWKDGKRPAIEKYYHQALKRDSIRLATTLPNLGKPGGKFMSCVVGISVVIGLLAIGFIYIKRK